MLNKLQCYVQYILVALLAYAPLRYVKLTDWKSSNLLKPSN
jgi:hypothetical protein